jgi:hypothetical protein
MIRREWVRNVNFEKARRILEVFSHFMFETQLKFSQESKNKIFAQATKRGLVHLKKPGVTVSYPAVIGAAGKPVTRVPVVQYKE